MAELTVLGIHVKRRLTYSKMTSAITTLLSIAMAFITIGGLFSIMGLDAVSAFTVIGETFITPNLLLQACLRSIPIILSSLGLAIAFRMNFWNIGAEGQIWMGMYASTGIVLLHEYYGLIPDFILLPLMFISAFIAGGAWCLLPAVLKAKLGVNEILTTLMMNYIAILFVLYFVYGPWKDPRGYGFPLTIPFPEAARMKFILNSPSITGLLISLIVASLIYALFAYTKLGFELKVVGESPDAAKYAGMNIPLIISIGAFLSGGFAGLGGLSIVSGIIGRLRPGASPGYGYTAIIVSWLAGLNPWLIIPAGFFFGGLLTAGDALQASLNIPNSAIQIFQSVIFLFVILGEFMKRYEVSFGGGLSR